jgi:glycosyltransferase involved in cell wall biosynthesis
MKNVFYWSPFTSKVATVTAVINSAESINKKSNKTGFVASIIDATEEWSEYKEILDKKKISIIKINKPPLINVFNNFGFLKSRLTYWYIFTRSFFSLHNLIKKRKPEYLIIHLITSLPITLFILNKYQTKLVLRISGLPKMTLLRKLLWKIASKKIFKITCPTHDTYKDLSKFKFMRDKLIVLNDPVLNLNDINQKNVNEKSNQLDIKKFIQNKKFFLSVGRFSKQKNFLFYLECISQLLKKRKNLYFLFIGEGEERSKFIDIIEKKNLKENIFLLNYSDNVGYFMKKSEALVLTSLWEDPGFVLIEAAYNNCSVISSDCPNGPKELIGNDGGYLFKSNSKEDLIKSFNQFLSDNDDIKKIKKINLKKRAKKFTCFHHSKILINSILI